MLEGGGGGGYRMSISMPEETLEKGRIYSYISKTLTECPKVAIDI
jgi:hypothetical protein